MLIADDLVYLCLFATIDELIGSLAGDTHDMLTSIAVKQERTVGHTFFQNRDIRDVFRLCV